MMDTVYLLFNWSDLISVHRTYEGAERALAEEKKTASIYHGLGIQEQEVEE